MTNDIQNYFGFDLGDGESAVAWLREGASAAPLMLEIAGRKNVLTALGQSSERLPIIGEQALMLSSGPLYVRFKRHFLTQRASASRRILDYARCVLAEVERTGKLNDPAASAFFIGCPSGWPDEAREAYRRLFEEAGFPNVTVISESRAAFLFARESGELGLPDEALTKPALVIDAGSSTTDFTFIHALEARAAFDFGENALGGGLIDQALLGLNVARSENRAAVERIFADHPEYAARAEIEARKVKEMYFTRRMQPLLGGYSLPCESSVKLYAVDPPIALDIVATDADVEAILNEPLEALGGQSYLAAYERGLNQAASALAATPPELIMLTGGASRMDFMGRMARSAFPGARLVSGAEPEFAIARGLAYALRIDERTGRFMQGVKALIDSDAIELIVEAALPALMRAVAPVVADHLVAHSAPDAFGRWRRGEVKTVGDMQSAIQQSLVRSLESGDLKEALGRVTQQWLADVRPALERETDPICERSHLPPASLRLPSAAPGDALGIDVTRVEMLNLSLLQTVVDVTVGALVAAILGGGGVALLMTGPVGLIVSFVIGFVASRLGTTLARKHLDKFNMPAFMRMLFSKRLFENSLKSRRGEIESSVAEQLNGLLAGPDPAIARLTHEVSRAIENQLTDMAAQARLMIH